MSESHYFKATGPIPDPESPAAFYTDGSNIKIGAIIVGTEAGVNASSDRGVGISGTAKDHPGVAGVGNPGVSGEATGKGFGVDGGTQDVDAAGVRGVNTSPGGGVGVLGNATKGVGVKGVNKGSENNGAGVLGQGDSSDGVQGFTFAANRSGAAGVNESDGVGVFGFSANGNGMLAISAGAGKGLLAQSAQGIGVYAVTLSQNSVALVGVAHEGNSAAGIFEGKLFVIGGPFVVFGAKSAAVPHPDGSHRLLYSVESPESWFEDFGEAALINGTCTVKLDADFMSVVKNDHYHVFISAYGDTSGLFVSKRSKLEFEVQEHGNGKSHVRFSYRIVAKRKDVEGNRLAKVDLPHVPVPPPVPERPVLKPTT